MSDKTSIIMDIGIGSGSLEDIVSDSINRIDGKQPAATFVCANPHSLVVARNDAPFATALNNADYSVADGVGVTMAGNILGVDTGPRIAGYNYFEALMSALQTRGYGRVFFFGSSEDVLSLISEKLTNEYPDVSLCGTLSPPFGDWSEETNERMIETINSASPDILWVGMTAPKQEKWAEDNRTKLNARIIGSIGAVFDFYAGTYQRAPSWAGKIGLEWLYRLIKEPKRMWRRNFVSTPLFVLSVLSQRLRS